MNHILKRISTVRPVLKGAVAAIMVNALFVGPIYAQFVYEGMRQGIKYKVFIYGKEYLGDNRWRFQTKAVYHTGSKPYYSDWRTADCDRSTIDGEVVRAIPQYGYQEGEAQVLYKVCRR